MSTSNPKDVTAPLMAIRRFDVFAEYSRQEQLEKGLPEDQAKGYGVWIAKVVASRRFGSKKSDTTPKHKVSGDGRPAPESETEFRSVGDELQTDEVFDADIIERMGASFYDKVFVPAIEEARKHGKSYEDIRDSIRKEWKPAGAMRR
jgi:hypothetical protein